jgi:hypothetical protein
MGTPSTLHKGEEGSPGFILKFFILSFSRSQEESGK